ncbi:MAG: hypothetical protein UIH27_09045 [Ruminococcus sp.]|nr:hypothetical protein [Ruminococcus sp.]
MRDKNTMGIYGYIFDNVFWGLLAVFWYKRVLFTNVFDYDDDISKWVLYLTVFGFIAVGILITYNHRRNNVNVFINIACPFAVFTAVAYINYLKSFILILLIIAALASIAYVIMTKWYSSSLPVKMQRRFSIKRFSFLGARTIVTSSLMLIVVYLVFSTVTGVQLFRPAAEKAENDVPSFAEYYESNADTFNKLEQNTWNTLSATEKLDVLQVLCNAEKTKLGVKEPIYIKSKAFRSNLLGEFIPAENTILINAKHLEEDSSYSILTTVTHECYHCYERSLVKLYNSADEDQKKLMAFDRAKRYKEEFASYKDGENEGYYWQAVEVDAREYSEQAADEYKDKILSHLEHSK